MSYDGALTDARMALFRIWNNFLPSLAALEEPTKRAPMEQRESRISAFSDEGWNDDAWSIGRIGWNLAKYSFMHRFCNIIGTMP
jgi:hypothetical protein